MLAAACAALLLIAPASKASDSFVGVSVGSLYNADRSLIASGDSQLNRLGGTGVALGRVDATWHNVEPFGPYPGFARNWTASDRIAASLAQRGVRWFPVLGYATPWSTTVAGTDKAAPADPSLFASYAAGIAQRYGPGGVFWASHPELPELPVTAMELWNEPNLTAYWRPAPDPAAYANLYMTTHAAVQDVAPSVKLITGGLSPYAQPEAFLRRMYAARPDLIGHVDGIGAHPYAAGATGVVDEVVSIRATLNELGAGDVPIDVTELGWPLPNQSPTASFALPDRTRAGAMSLVADAMRNSDCGVERLMLFTWTTPETDPAEQEDWFGLVHPDGSPTAAQGALAAAAGRSATGSPLAMCGAPRSRTSTLKLSLDARRTSRRCVAATVSYRDDPVNRIPVQLRQGTYSVTLNSDDDGTVTRCSPKARKVSVRAAAGAWAASPTRRR
jgi:hypothetical protein